MFYPVDFSTCCRGQDRLALPSSEPGYCHDFLLFPIAIICYENCLNPNWCLFSCGFHSIRQGSGPFGTSQSWTKVFDSFLFPIDSVFYKSCIKPCHSVSFFVYHKSFYGSGTITVKVRNENL